MLELRQIFFTKGWVVIATERAKRPEQLIDRAPRPEADPILFAELSVLPRKRGPHSPRNSAAAERRQLPENSRHSQQVAALARQVPPARTIHRSRRTIQGFGVHDVIVETPDHSQAMAGMSDTHMADPPHLQNPL
jgi:UDPglucose--hexose-1-phosphate uridylyltransferase